MLIVKKESIRLYKTEIGIILSIFSIPLASVLNEYTKGRYEITNVMLLLSLFLITDFNNLLKCKLQFSKDNLIVLFFQVYLIIIELLKGQSLFEQASGMIYTIFTLVIILCVVTMNRIERPEHFINTAWWILGIFNMLLLWLETDGLRHFSARGEVYLEYGMDRITRSKLAFVFIIVALLHFAQEKIHHRIALAVFMLATAFNLLHSGRRSTAVYVLIIFILHIFYYGKSEKRTQINSKKILKFVCIVGASIAFLWAISNIITDFSEMVNHYYLSIKNAITTITRQSTADPAALVRNELYSVSFHLLLEETSLYQYIFGRGYMYKYLDFPILQAIIDMGLLFGTYYIIIQFVLPLKYLKKRNGNVAEQFFKYFVLLFIFDNFFAGIPYGYGKFIPLIFLFSQVQIKGRNLEEIDNINKAT